MGAPGTVKVIIGPSTFAAEDRAPLDLLQAAGIEVLPNPVRRRWTRNEAVQFLKGVDGLLAGLEPLDRQVLSSTGGRLKALARVGIGMDNVDQVAARELGIKVSNTPGAPTEAVAEMTLAALLCLTRNIEPMNRDMHGGGWPKSVARSLHELTVLVVGYGRIGRTVARQLASLGCTILVTDPFLPETAECAFPQVDMYEGLKRSEVVTLHASGEHPVLTAAEFALVKPGLILLNPARGALVDEAALVQALNSGAVGKAWFDTFWREPYDGPLKHYPQVLLTPHACTYTRHCRLSMESEAVRNLLRDLGVGA